MNQTVLRQSSTVPNTLPLARLSAPHGYRFDGDRVYLHSRFTVLANAAHQRNWALQLWACNSTPASNQALSGHMVAEVALPPISEVADDSEQVDMDAFANPPVGDADHIMALVLASGKSGQFDEVHDIAAYAHPHRFLHPRMRGTVSYRIDGNRVHLSVEHIENAREASNRSGTLALELWALPTQYSGGSFQGTPLAGVAIGSLAGQTESTITSFDLPFARPTDGVWRFVLMLREWTSGGYITRDYCNFQVPVSYGSTPSPKTAPTESTPTGSPVNKPAGAVQAGAPSAPQRVEQALPLNAKLKAETLQPVKPAVALKNPPLVSINTGTEADLCAIEGLSPKLVQRIIKKRPFASLDDLRRIKGITAKLLAGIRSRLRL